MSTLPYRLMEKGPVKGRRLLTRDFKDQFAGWVFSAPAFVLLFIFMIIPFFMAFFYAFTDQHLLPDSPAEFVGLENFSKIFLDDVVFHRALLNNFYFAAVVVPLQTALALFMAIMINRKMKGIMIFRVIYFMPFVTAIAVMAVVWIFFYQPKGIINGFLSAISFGHLGPYRWFGDPILAMPAIIIFSIWQGAGMQMLFIWAGLQNISEELYEAARIDGAGPVSCFINVTLPQLRNPLIAVSVLTATWAFKLFAQVQVMTQGGPESATVTSVYQIVQEGFTGQRVGYASALAVVFFVIVLIVSLLQYVFGRER